jgi:hypothetical protein
MALRGVELIGLEQAQELQRLYGFFDLGYDGLPTPGWAKRNLRFLRLPEGLRCAFFPTVWVRRVYVNRRMADAIEKVLLEICARFTPQFRSINGLDQFVKCYCFGDGSAPNLFWYGAAWRLSEQVGGPALEDARQIFVRHGFTHAWTTDKNRLRDFEFW